MQLICTIDVRKLFIQFEKPMPSALVSPDTGVRTKPVHKYVRCASLLDFFPIYFDTKRVQHFNGVIGRTNS